MTERDYAIRSFKEVTLNAARHTEERMNLYYGKIKELMNNYQDLILEGWYPLCGFQNLFLSFRYSLGEYPFSL